MVKRTQSSRQSDQRGRAASKKKQTFHHEGPTTKVAKSPAQQSRNRKNRNISRKDAKARSKTFLISPSDTSPWVGMMAFDPSLSVLATWRENIRSESLRLLQNFARGAKIMKHSSTKLSELKCNNSESFVSFMRFVVGWHLLVDSASLDSAEICASCENSQA